jgi:hypothetical protein
MLRMVSYPHRPQSGHIMCYLNRTYHVLPTRPEEQIAKPYGIPLLSTKHPGGVFFPAQQSVRKLPNRVRGMVNTGSGPHSTNRVEGTGLWISRIPVLVVDGASVLVPPLYPPHQRAHGSIRTTHS